MATRLRPFEGGITRGPRRREEPGLELESVVAAAGAATTGALLLYSGWMNWGRGQVHAYPLTLLLVLLTYAYGLGLLTLALVRTPRLATG